MPVSCVAHRGPSQAGGALGSREPNDGVLAKTRKEIAPSENRDSLGAVTLAQRHQDLIVVAMMLVMALAVAALMVATRIVGPIRPLMVTRIAGPVRLHVAARIVGPIRLLMVTRIAGLIMLHVVTRVVGPVTTLVVTGI